MFIWGCLQQCYIRIGTGLHDGIIINRSLWVTRGRFSRSESLIVDFGRQTFYWDSGAAKIQKSISYMTQ